MDMDSGSDRENLEGLKRAVMGRESPYLLLSLGDGRIRIAILFVRMSMDSGTC